MKKNRKATFAEYARVCNHYLSKELCSCKTCPLGQENNPERELCSVFVTTCTDKANDIIVKWCDEHPVKTRQSELLKIFPKARIDDGVMDLCPDEFERGFQHPANCVDCSQAECDECRKKFWLEEIE